MQGLAKFDEYNCEWQFHQVDHSLEAVYRWNRQIHTLDIYIICHLPAE